MTQLEEWQLKGIADTLRLVANHFHSSDRKTCLDRMVMESWNWVVDALNDIPIETTSDNGIMYRMRVGQTPKLKNYKLDDVVATRVDGTIIPHHIAKQELIEDLKKHMKGE